MKRQFIKDPVDNGANFKKMWEATANPDWFDSFAFTDGSSTYLMTVHGTSQGLNRQYQRFARYFVFDAASPMPALSDSLHSEVAAYRTTVSDDDGESKLFYVKGGHTAKVWGSGSATPSSPAGRSCDIACMRMTCSGPTSIPVQGLLRRILRDRKTQIGRLAEYLGVGHGKVRLFPIR